MDSKENNNQRDKIINSNIKGIKAYLANGIYGLDIKKDEKRKYLGQYKERVLKVLTKEQIKRRWIYPDIIEAIKNPDSRKVIVKNEYRKPAKKYIYYANKYNKHTIITSDEEYKGNIALVVAADEPVETSSIYAGEKTKQLINNGLPEEIVQAGSGKLCSKHFRKLTKLINDPLNFERLDFWDKLIGEECSACRIKEE